MFRRRSPAQHASFLKYASQLSIEFDDDSDVQTNFDKMYSVMRDLIDCFYPERRITVTSSDPQYVTPAVKAMLRRMNRLMRAERTDEAGALAKRIQIAIMRKNSKWLRNIDIKKNAKDVWAKVREVVRGTGQDNNYQNEGITAQVSNDHCVAILTDCGYCPQH